MSDSQDPHPLTSKLSSVQSQLENAVKTNSPSTKYTSTLRTYQPQFSIKLSTQSYSKSPNPLSLSKQGTYPKIP